jgi:hypothetical protein
MTPLNTLQDLLTVQALSQITPQRLQAWQQALRSLIDAAADRPVADTVSPSTPETITRNWSH